LPVGQIHIDHCYRCGGSFFDFGEAQVAIGWEADPRAWRPEAMARPPMVGRVQCPAGHGPMWSYLLAWEGKQVEIDTCGHCYGLWLDANEAEMLHAITAESTAEQQRPGASRGGVATALVYLIQLATFIPVEVYNPVRRKPVLVYSLLATNIALYAIEMVLIASKQIDPFLQSFAAVPDKIVHGQNLWTLFTHAFLHGSIPHLVGNMYYLWIFGDNVEDRLGRGRFTILYLVSTVVACLSHVLGNVGSAEVMVGASGAIAGLMGAYLVLFPRVKVWVVFLFVPFKMRAIWYLLVWIGMQFLIMLDKKSNVAWLAHVGGFICGIVLAFLLKPKDATPALPRRA
jgi:membrane associated rhomboid family serine protease/Zn-finger nucleic acid-binding protein